MLLRLAVECSSDDRDARPALADVVADLTSLYEALTASPFVPYEDDNDDEGDDAATPAPPKTPEAATDALPARALLSLTPSRRASVAVGLCTRGGGEGCMRPHTLHDIVCTHMQLPTLFLALG
jgi:hypothetical protein